MVAEVHRFYFICFTSIFGFDWRLVAVVYMGQALKLSLRGLHADQLPHEPV